MRRRIYFTGASGVGKTTLAQYIASRYGYHRLASATRQALSEEFGTSDFDILNDPDKLDHYQMAVLKKQIALEAACQVSFVSDRCFDCFALTSEYARVAWKVKRSPEFQGYLDSLRFSDDPVIIFFVRPTQVCLEAARRDPQGRQRFLDWEAMARVDGAIQHILESEEIKYLPIDTPNLRSRFRILDCVIPLLVK